MNDFYEFRKEDAYSFAHSTYTKTRVNNGELVFDTCPYCHSEKDKWKFSINLSSGQFQCKRASCGAKGNMITLARDFNLDLGRDNNNYYELPKKDKYRKFKLDKEIEVKDAAVSYLESRGISKEITKKYNITTKGEDSNILVFPFLDDKKQLVTIKYRKTNFNKDVDKNKEWFEANCKPILFGMYQCEDFKRLVITEGQIDSLSVAEAGIQNAVSVPNGANGFSWVAHCWDWVSMFEEIVVFGDCEHGSVTLADQIKKRFNKTNIRVVRIKDYKDCKDANELLQKHGKDAVILAVNNAELVVSDKIIRASSVEAVDVENTPSVSTGIDALDKAMSGGFRKGELIVITGKRGDGKSTFVSQLVCNVLNDKESKVFMYSGEMININVKRWIDMQLVGTKQIYNSTIEKLNAWYDDRLFFFDNTAIAEDETVEILKIAEQAIGKYGCNFIILDNLMTAIDSGSNDVYKMQSAFAKKCAALARRTETTILLICHPRKSGGEEFDNDFISGSADITNAANYVLCYQRFKNSQPNERRLTVNKNRLTGKLLTGDNGILLIYSEDSKRIADRFTDFNHMHYGWMDEEDAAPEWMNSINTEIVTEDETIPF